MHSEPSFLAPKISPPLTPVFPSVSASHCNEVIQGHVVVVNNVSVTGSRATGTSWRQPVRNVLGLTEKGRPNLPYKWVAVPPSGIQTAYKGESWLSNPIPPPCILTAPQALATPGSHHLRLLPACLLHTLFLKLLQVLVTA